MAADEKAQAKGEQVEGKVKKVVGGAVGNESMKAEGRADETKGDLRQAKEKAKDAIKE
ncbi:CsbD family protein [Streptomyces sp. NBC_01260]|uniref:CsbD family protein n=1 Tax=Streptomyces laculatispora TaxID=887464 RepID=A0ABY9I563_9ACTN|nr:MULTISPECIES: CsbD family protein [Streptomyces]MBO0919162.1 CsbD family protein [Streptomyces laculatispora]MCX4770672.1 CsbD family protein [Streptomyces sp. NBC_01285]ROQ81940.1 CsbD-like protein [Streptomyces sp. CEV 2-1]RPK45791.1 CsbD-like protein [Streptomyces sp. ADI92-24]WLQ41459.1 CsbD family protein [Streptomyces laculatispora]